MVEKNLNIYDKILRIIVSIILIIVAQSENISIINSFLLYFLAIFLIITVAIGWCGFYAIFEISSLNNSLKTLSKNSCNSELKKYKAKIKNRKK